MEYCRGSAEHHKYAVIDVDTCTCATDITFDKEREPLNAGDSPKWLTNQCGMSESKTMIGSADNNVAALYNIEYGRKFATEKYAPTTCRSISHEFFYTSYGIERYSLQSDIKKPVLRVLCDYKNSNICVHPLLHSMDSSAFTIEPSGAGYGRREYTASKMNLNSANNLAYITVCNQEIQNQDRVCFVKVNENITNSWKTTDGHLTTTNDLKLIITFPEPTLIQGIWWSAVNQWAGTLFGYLTSIKKMSFSFPASMGGDTFTSNSIGDIVKTPSDERSDMSFTYFKQPILTERLELSVFTYKMDIGNNWWRWSIPQHHIAFSMELFGCSNYQPDTSTYIFSAFGRNMYQILSFQFFVLRDGLITKATAIRL